jgi:hypothetical protein
MHENVIGESRFSVPAPQLLFFEKNMAAVTEKKSGPCNGPIQNQHASPTKCPSHALGTQHVVDVVCRRQPTSRQLGRHGPREDHWSQGLFTWAFKAVSMRLDFP